MTVVLKATAFYPGNIVAGYLEVNSPVEVPVQSLHLKLTGKEQTESDVKQTVVLLSSFVSVMGMSRDQELAHVTGILQQAQQMQNTLLQGDEAADPPPELSPEQLLQQEVGKSCVMLPPGKYVYPFSFSIPLNLPPSFSTTTAEGQEGYAGCEYCVKAMMSVFGDPPLEVASPFRVLCAMPQAQYEQLNRAANRPSQRDSVALTSCCCISKGIVECEVSPAKRVFAVDRDLLAVDMVFDCTHAKVDLCGVKLQLKHTVTVATPTAASVVLSSQVVGESVVDCSVVAGQIGTIRGEIAISRQLAASARLFHCSSAFTVCAVMKMGSVFVSNAATSEVPVVIVHSVAQSAAWDPPAYSYESSSVYVPLQQRVSKLEPGSSDDEEIGDVNTLLFDLYRKRQIHKEEYLYVPPFAPVTPVCTAPVPPLLDANTMLPPIEWAGVPANPIFPDMSWTATEATVVPL